MSIPESRLEIWAHQGAVTQSSSTYETIKRALEATGSGYAHKSYRIFLQGSYCNDTNIYSESDVDVVLLLQSMFFHDLTALAPTEKQAFDAAYSNVDYPYSQYKADVVAQLRKVFGSAVTVGSKAVTVDASGNRRRADILVAAEFRRYHGFRSQFDESYESGVCFLTSAGARVENYPRQHSDNCTAKHQATNGWFKPVVRIIKNLRCRMEDEGILPRGNAPSYFLEGLLYNVPNSQFGADYQSTLLNCFNWIVSTDRSDFVCANEQHYLLRDGYSYTWSAAKCDAFLVAASTVWDQW